MEKWGKNGNRRYKYLVLSHKGPYFVKEHSDKNKVYWHHQDARVSSWQHFRGLRRKSFQTDNRHRIGHKLCPSPSRYGPLSQTLHDILDDDHIQWHPSSIRLYTNLWPCYWSEPYYRIWLFNLIARGFHRHLQRVRLANRGHALLEPGPVPLWDLQVFSCCDQSLLNLSCFRTFEFRTLLGTSVLLCFCTCSA